LVDIILVAGNRQNFPDAVFSGALKVDGDAITCREAVRQYLISSDCPDRLVIQNNDMIDTIKREDGAYHLICECRDS